MEEYRDERGEARVKYYMHIAREGKTSARRNSIMASVS